MEDNCGKRLCRRQQQSREEQRRGVAQKRERLHNGLRIQKSSVGERMADSCFPTAPTGLILRVARTRKNSVSRATARQFRQRRPVPLRERVRGEPGGRRAVQRFSRAAASGPDSTKRAARLLAQGSVPSRVPAAGRAASSAVGQQSPTAADGAGEGTRAPRPGLASWSPRLGGGVRAARGWEV